LLEGIIVKSLEPFSSVFNQLIDAEELSGCQCNVSTHNGDVGIAGADVSAFDGVCGVDDGVFDLPLKLIGQAVHVVVGDLEKLRAAEICPVPVGR